MKIKRYIGKTPKEAMDVMREDLGPEAVVLNAKTIREGGFFKIFRKPKFEITAALEKVEDSKADENTMADIKKELLELKGILENVPRKETLRQEKLDESLRGFLRIMVKNGMNLDIGHGILTSIGEENNLNIGQDEIEKLIRKKLREIIGKPEPITIGNSQKRVFFIGPTGVGKTTTLAKLAANLVMESRYDIGLITSDTYRVGAVDQLKIYGDILKLPLEIAYNPEDMIKSFDIMKDKDIILIDTAGRNHKNEGHIRDLRKILDATDDKEVYLVISGTSDIKVLESLLIKFSFLSDYKILVTKIDESNGFGNIFNIAYIFEKQIPYYTMGQDVPDDIDIVDVDYIIDELLKEI